MQIRKVLRKKAHSTGTQKMRAKDGLCGPTPHFTEEKNEAQKSKGTYLKSPLTPRINSFP